MEIAKVGDTEIKIKTKLATISITPSGKKAKVIADAVVVFSQTQKESLPSFETQPLIIEGPGEYEIKGVKLTGVGKTESAFYGGKFDGVSVIFMQGERGTANKDMLQECQIAVVDANVVVDQSVLGALGAQVLILYGMNAEETMKKLGKTATPVGKYVTTKDKLPNEMEVVLLA